MNDVEQALLESLLDLESAIQSMATAQPKPNLVSHFGRIDALAAQLPAESDPSLLHYLRKKSYEKARLHLQGREAENQLGICRHD